MARWVKRFKGAFANLFGFGIRPVEPIKNRAPRKQTVVSSAGERINMAPAEAGRFLRPYIMPEPVSKYLDSYVIRTINSGDYLAPKRRTFAKAKGFETQMSAMQSAVGRAEGKKVAPTKSAIQKLEKPLPGLLQSELSKPDEARRFAEENSPIISFPMSHGKEAVPFGKVYFVDSARFPESAYMPVLEKSGFQLAESKTHDMMLVKKGFTAEGEFKGYELRVYFVPHLIEAIEASAIGHGYVPVKQ